MKTQWNKVNNRIIIQQGMPLAARLIALPFLLVAAYLGYQLVGALWDNLLAFSLSMWLENAVGLVVLVVFVLVFALPGLFLLLSTKQVIVDADKRQVTEEMRWLALARQDRYSTETFRAVRVSYEVGTSGTDSDRRAVLFTYDVTLVDERKRFKLLAMFETSELSNAQALARDVSNLLQLDLRDDSAGREPALPGDIALDNGSPG